MIGCVGNAGPPAIVQPAPDFGTPPRIVRLRLTATVFGVSGDGMLVVDRDGGRFALHLNAGPAGEAQGFDGTRAWRADATGMPRIEGNVDQRAALVDFARLLSPGGGNGRLVNKYFEGDNEVLECAGLGSRPVQITVDPNSGFVHEVDQHVGANLVHTTFDDYRAVEGLIVPFAIERTDDNGVWDARVTGVTTAAAAAGDELSVPPRPDDSNIQSGDHPVALAMGSQYPIVPVTIDGVKLHCILDTGGQNVITPDVAKRIRAQVVGGGTVSGAGAGLASVGYAWIERMQVGPVELRHQPALVLSIGKLVSGVDGIVGYELLARYAARLDFAHSTVSFSSKAFAPERNASVAAMRFLDRQPEVDGNLDGIGADMAIDTGNTGSVDTNTPFAQAHRLAYRYARQIRGMTYAGVGGDVSAELVRAHELRIGSAKVPDPIVSIASATAGFEADPTVAANIGMMILHHFTVIFDYPQQRVTLVPAGPPARDPWPDKSGIVLTTIGDKLAVGSVLSPTPASEAGLKPGDLIPIADGAPFTANDAVSLTRLLTGPDGTVVHLIVRRGDERRHVDLTLRTYL